MNRLPICALIIFLLILGGSFLATIPAIAVTIAQQNQAWSDQLNVWDAIQELGNNLGGTLSSFTFRVHTSLTNLNQFDFTGLNTRLYDKDNNNSSIVGCIPSSSDPLSGLTFSTSGVPLGFEDVTIDFSCRNYTFITGHRYLMQVSNANMAQFGGKRIQFAAAAYGSGGHSGSTDQFTGGGLRYAFDNGFCSASSYVWNSQTNNNGCNVWTTPKDDLYFVLANTAPPPRLPVVFIPGIGGSEMKAAQDIVWSAQDGHGGTYQHAYSSGEKIWVNSDEAKKLGDDDYFDVLRLKADGQTPEASVSLTGNLNSFGYLDIDPFFTGMGYVKGNNFFIFNYDWRKDVRSNQADLDSLIENAKTSSGQSKVNLVVHSLGGLIARNYISDATKAAKVNKLIELGVPHVGTTFALKTIMYGILLGRPLIGNFGIGVASSEVHDFAQNSPSVFDLLPSSQYFSFYNNSDKDHPYPFRDDRDIDNNNVMGVLNYDQTKSLLSNLSYNMTVFNLAEQFHTSIDSIYNQTNGVKIHEIVGSSQPTLGQIQETWWITWPINLIPKQDEIFINGDDTIPLYSASLKSDSQDLSGAFKIYYVEQKHSDLVSQNGTAMQTVKSILNDDNALPVDVKDQKIALEGQQVSVDDADLDLYDDSNNHTGLKSNGDVETNISDTFYDSLGKTKHVFVKKSAVKKPTAKITSSNTVKAKIKIRNYSQDSINKTTYYSDVPVTSTTPVQFVIDPNSPNAPTLSAGTQTFLATSEATGSAALDQTSPNTSIQIFGTKDSFGIYTGSVTITLTGSDTSSGILRIEYSLDNGQTVQTYTGPFTISTPGKTTIQFKSIDKLGNEEIPQTFTIEIAPTPTPTPTPTSSTSTSGNSSTSTSTESTTNTSKVGFDSFEVSGSILGITFKNPSHISDQINISKTLDNNLTIKPFDSAQGGQSNNPSVTQILSGLLIVSAITIGGASLLLAATFFHPIPK